MPLPWVAVLASIVLPGGGNIQSFDGDLIVTSHGDVKNDVKNNTYTFSNRVVATYGQTTIKADHLELHLAEADEWGQATGHVHLNDPDGTLDADNLAFSWKKDPQSAQPERERVQSGSDDTPWKRGQQGGHADRVKALIEGVLLEADSADVSPTRWVFRNVYLAPSQDRVPLYAVRTSKLVVYPGKKGRARYPELLVLGRKLLHLPTQMFNLDPRVIGIHPPNITYRKADGFGVSWISGIVVNEETTLTASYDSFPRTYPGYGAQLTRTFVPADVSRTLVAPRSELGERFDFGFLENIQITRPSDEPAWLQEKRNSVSLGSQWNQQATDRGGDFAFSKAFEATYEFGGKAASSGFLGQVRLQDIRDQAEPFSTRAVLYGSYGLPSVKLGSHLETLSRLDASAFVGQKDFGWGRALAGVVFEPSAHVRLSGGLVGAFQSGTPQFNVDPLAAGSGGVVRADFQYGPRKFSYLVKYDTSLGWYDKEYYISQYAGSLEPYILYRRYPSDYRFGIRLRIDRFVDMLRRRKFDEDRSSGKATTISP